MRLRWTSAQKVNSRLSDLHELFSKKISRRILLSDRRQANDRGFESRTRNAESAFTLNRRAEFVMTALFADLPPWIDWSPSALAEEVSRTYAENTLQSGVFSRQQRCGKRSVMR